MALPAAVACSLAFAADLRGAESPAETTTLLARGKYLATASDCAACHTAPNGKSFAGGLAIATPLGAIHASNITPSKESGIGLYSEEDFSRAVRQGIRGDGANLYPAMPYTSYARFTDADVHALYVYFMNGVAVVDQKAPETALPFPMNIRLSMKAWNLLFLDRQPFVADAQRSAEWNRGAYLAQGAAHCSTCHTARGFLMQEDGNRQLGGANVGPWLAPNITPDPISGIGSWSQAELVDYLRTGHLLRKAQAAGSMAEAVERSFQYLTASDLDAIALYIRSVPAIRNARDKTSRFDQGGPRSMLAELRGTGGVTNDQNLERSGAALFQGNCASCHSARAQGSKDGYYPSLFRNSVTGASMPDNLIATILYGVNRTTAKEQAFMPGFGGSPADANQLGDRDIAAIANYVFQHFGNPTTTASEQQVAQARRGGPASSLVLLARVGLGIGVFVIVLLLLVFALRRNRQPQRPTVLLD
jgi:mono/diheme cytochrome c family protein